MQAAERWRFAAIVVVGLLLLAALVLRLLYLQLSTTESGSQHLQQASDRRLVSDSAVPGIRGEIVDRRGNLLAYSTPTVSIGFRHGVVVLEEGDVQIIADSLNLDRSALEARLDSHPRFVYLKRRMPPEEAASAMRRMREALSVDSALFDSLLEEKVEFKRFYPAGEVVSHIVGYTDVDDRGQEGIELAFDEQLSGTPGLRRTVRNARRQIIGETKLLELSKPGADVALTIDLQLQAIAHTELKAVVEKHNATSGSIVLLDVSTGDVLALASQPSFNANDRSSLIASKVRNRALLDVFEPGSTVKPFTFAAGLEDSTFSMDTLINTNPGFLRIDGHAVHDIRNHGLITAADALVKSSQVGTAKLSMLTEGESIRSLFDRVGFGEYCATGFPGEQVGYLPSHRSWTGAQKAILGYGYGLEVNALQLARAYSVLGDRGRQKPVRLVKSVQAAGSASDLVKPDRVEIAEEAIQVMQPEVAEKILTAMRDVVDRGTGKRAQVRGYAVAGKTGTTHKVQNGVYLQDQYRATFAGLIPADQPRIAAVITVDRPKGAQYYGGEVAAPVFSRVMQQAVRILNISPATAEDAVFESGVQFSDVSHQRRQFQ